MVASAAVALSDVVVDSLVVEKARDEAEAASLQSVAWGSRYVGAIGAALLSGEAIRVLGARGCFGATAALLTCFSVMSAVQDHATHLGLDNSLGKALRCALVNLENWKASRIAMSEDAWRALAAERRAPGLSERTIAAHSPSISRRRSSSRRRPAAPTRHDRRIAGARRSPD